MEEDPENQENSEMEEADDLDQKLFSAILSNGIFGSSSIKATDSTFGCRSDGLAQVPREPLGVCRDLCEKP